MNNRITMKEMPVSERPYEKCRDRGPEYLSDAELLSVILRSGTRERSALELAGLLLSGPGRKKGLAFLMDVTRQELTAIPGIGPVKASELQCIGELGKRIARARSRNRVTLTSPSSIADYFMEDMSYLQKEHILAAMFDTKNNLIHSEQISIGTVNASLASPREIFTAALRHGAVSLVLLHNHPSGDPAPSFEDRDLTSRLCEAGELLHVPVLDHIIIGDHRYFSFREEGLMPHTLV